jgi:hypothetical protein
MQNARFGGDLKRAFVCLNGVRPHGEAESLQNMSMACVEGKSRSLAAGLHEAEF